MTHGDIWLPLNPNDPASPMLYCEAWSDGYLSGAGYGALCSSSQIERVCQLSALLAGSPVFYVPSLRVFKAKEGDYLGESFCESNDFEGDAEEVEAMVDEAVSALESGDAQGALSGRLSLISLQSKLDQGFGGNAMILPPAEAWASVLERHNGSDDWDSPEAARQLAKSAASPTTTTFHTGNDYFWRDGQFWGMVSLGDEEPYYAAPLIQLAALSRSRGPYGDFPGYLAEITEADRSSLLDLLHELKANGQGVDGLFDGSCDAEVNSLYEKAILETTAGDTAPVKRSPTL